MEYFFGGHWTEVDFITLMLQRAIGGLTEEFCQQCGNCVLGCPMSKVIQGFTPRQIVSQVRLGQVKTVLRSDIIWDCTPCLLCKERCPDETSPYEIIKTLRNLSARIGYHFPRDFTEFNKKVYLSGIIQDSQTVSTRNGKFFKRSDLDLPSLDVPVNMEKFTEAIDKLVNMRVFI